MALFLKMAAVGYSFVRSYRSYRRVRKDKEERDRQRLESYTAPPESTVSEGDTIPVIFGTVDLPGPALVGRPSRFTTDGIAFIDMVRPDDTNYINQTDDDGEPLGHQQIFLHMIFCQGPVDEVVEIRSGDTRLYGSPDKVVGSTEADVVESWDLRVHYDETGDSIVEIDDYFDNTDGMTYFGPTDYSLTGGGRPQVSRWWESQPLGTWDFFAFMGGWPDQPEDDLLAVNVADDEGVPAFRSVFGIRGLYIWAFGGELPEVSARVKRRRTGSFGENLSDYLASQPWVPGDSALVGEDMNAVAAIEEVIRDEQMGLGIPRRFLSDNHFLYASSEAGGAELGISGVLRQREDAAGFVAALLTQIDGGLYEDPETGLLCVRLARDDYDLDAMTQQAGDFTTKDIETFGPAQILDIRDAGLEASTLVNEIELVYDDRRAKRRRTITDHDTADQMMRGPISQEVQYPFVLDGGIASRLAARDLRDLSTPLRQYRITLPASVAEDLRTLDVFELIYPKWGIESSILRVTSMRTTGPLEQTVEVEAIQDVFAVAEEVIRQPDDIDVPALLESPEPAETYATETPFWWEYERVRGEINPATLPTHIADENRGQAMLAAHTTQGAAYSWDLVTAPLSPEDRGRPFSPRVAISYSAGVNAETVSSSGFTFDLEGQELGLRDDETHVFFEVDGSIVAFTGFTGDTPSTLQLGWFDTAPIFPPPDDDLSETHYLVLGYGRYEGDDLIIRRAAGIDPRRRPSAATVDVYALPRTARGRLDRDAIETPDEVTIQSRLYAPYPPGRVRHSAFFDEPEDKRGFMSWTWRQRWKAGQQRFQDINTNIAPPAGWEWELEIYEAPNTDISDLTLLRVETFDRATLQYSYENLDELDDRGSTDLADVLHVKMRGIRPDGTKSLYQTHRTYIRFPA